MAEHVYKSILTARKIVNPVIGRRNVFYRLDGNALRALRRIGIDTDKLTQFRNPFIGKRDRWYCLTQRHIDRVRNDYLRS